ncbi:hypothetical protein [Kitasatospora viridis]|uniref:Uncharacterized protein n=1 Tax=Kitasatospora viridis TaxID=281105 RepID=A0A561SDP1_9ACTN|nr:hypothetical protein [Kitasatospora viridis]TWF72991.1 hypothetical protein FHX73_16142 [Kitasatospora viridis]
MQPFPPLPPHTVWYDTGTNVFRFAARADGQWWVLRLNGFPDHPLYTLFIGGRVVGDLYEPPASWGLDEQQAPLLGAVERAEMLGELAGLGPYGAEVGRPCDGDYCTCQALTDEFAAQVTEKR